jgi:hypothetical protein
MRKYHKLDLEFQDSYKISIITTQNEKELTMTDVNGTYYNFKTN